MYVHARQQVGVEPSRQIVTGETQSEITKTGCMGSLEKVCSRRFFCFVRFLKEDVNWMRQISERSEFRFLGAQNEKKARWQKRFCVRYTLRIRNCPEGSICSVLSGGKQCRLEKRSVRTREAMTAESL